MKKLLVLLATTASLFAMEPLVSAKWLVNHSGDKNLVIVDVSTGDAYNKSHIKDAVHSGLGKWRQPKGGSAFEIRPTKELESEIRSLGINNNSNVVVYSHNLNPKDLLKAPYVIWALSYLGLESVSLLDGGIDSYIKAGGKVTTSKSTVRQGNFTASIQDSMLIDMQGVKKQIGKTPMIDSRPAKYYFGTDKQGVLKRAGHISGAKSYSWKYSMNKDNTLKSKKVLSQTIEQGLGLNTKNELIIYCTGGLEASMNYFVFHKVLGFKKAKLYDSSMLEWANRDDTPMIKYRWE